MANKLKNQKTYYDETLDEELSEVIMVLDQLNMNKGKQQAHMVFEVWANATKAGDRKFNKKIRPLPTSYTYDIQGAEFEAVFGDNAVVTKAPEGFLHYAQAYDWLSKLKTLPDTDDETGEEIPGVLIWGDWITNQ